MAPSALQVTLQMPTGGWWSVCSRLPDEMGLRGVGDCYPIRDFHATILPLLGLDQNRLWFLNNGRNEKLTDFNGNVINEMLA